MQLHWHKGCKGAICPERAKYFSEGLATVFKDENDIKALNQFEEYNMKSQS
jgi:hypothetical protein